MSLIQKIQERVWSRALKAGLATALLSSALCQVPGYALTATDPEPQDKTKPENLLKRFRGQTEFLNLSYSQAFPTGAKAGGGGAEAAAFGAADGARQEQESDVFKIGENGSKLLYLLNHYRGLQVVSFKDGLEKPELVGRIQTSHNWSEDMYFDAKNKRIYVLERLWYDYSAAQNYKRDSRIVIYDVSNEKAPKEVKSIAIPGEIADHRMVGDVLYVATSSWNQNGFKPWGVPQDAGPQGQGHIFSYALDKDDVKLVDQMTLSKPVSSRELLSIHSVKTAEGQYKYYLVAALTENRWSWWDRRSYIELVDISDPKGKIYTSMIAHPRGFIAKRSQVQFKNNTMVVVSNYVPAGKNASQRIAVESFDLPDTTKAVRNAIDMDEANFRVQWIAHQVQKAGDEVKKKEEAYLDAIGDEKFGLKGVVVYTKQDGPYKNKLQKWVADRTLITEDARGQNTTIFDVRASANYLYVFWFPGSKDPLEVFTFDKPQEAIEHLVHKEFPGFISRSFPVQYNGREYLIGLGFVPVEGKPAWHRRPQAILFDVIRSGELADAKIVATSELSEQDNVWTNFSGSDKFTEIRFENNDPSSGKGYILFQIDAWGKDKYLSGGKLMGFDLGKAKASAKEVFTSGAVLQGSASWLRRVFTNPELAAVNTFSNEALGTFKMPKNYGRESEIVKAVSVLELARNVQSYLTQGEFGYQLITASAEGSYTPTLVLRKVSIKTPDSEKKDVLSETVMAKGNLADYYRKGDALYVLTYNSRYETKEDPNGKNPVYKYFNDYVVTLVNLADGKLSGSVAWTEEQKSWGRGFGGPVIEPVGLADVASPKAASMVAGGRGMMMGRYIQPHLSSVQNQLFAVTGEGMRRIDAARVGIMASPVDVSSCTLPGEKKAKTVQVEVIGGKLYALYSELVKTDEQLRMSYVKNYVSAARLVLDKLQCEKAVQIPGKPVMITAENIVSQDQRLLYIESYDSNGKTYHYPVTKFTLTSLNLNLKGTTATLADLYEDDQRYGYEQASIVGSKLVYLGQDRNNRFGQSVNDWVELTLDKEGRFTQELSRLKLGAGYWSLAAIKDYAQQSLVVFTNGHHAAVYDLKAGERLSPRKVRAVQADGKLSEPAYQVEVPGFYGGYSWRVGNMSSLNLDSVNKTMEFAGGMFGVTQVSLE